MKFAALALLLAFSTSAFAAQEKSVPASAIICTADSSSTCTYTVSTTVQHNAATFAAPDVSEYEDEDYSCTGPALEQARKKAIAMAYALRKAGVCNFVIDNTTLGKN